VSWAFVIVIVATSSVTTRNTIHELFVLVFLRGFRVLLLLLLLLLLVLFPPLSLLPLPLPRNIKEDNICMIDDDDDGFTPIAAAICVIFFLFTPLHSTPVPVQLLRILLHQLI
jgi:hypothetical protein